MEHPKKTMRGTNPHKAESIYTLVHAVHTSMAFIFRNSTHHNRNAPHPLGYWKPRSTTQLFPPPFFKFSAHLFHRACPQLRNGQAATDAVLRHARFHCGVMLRDHKRFATGESGPGVYIYTYIYIYTYVYIYVICRDFNII